MTGEREKKRVKLQRKKNERRELIKKGGDVYDTFNF